MDILILFESIRERDLHRDRIMILRANLQTRDQIKVASNRLILGYRGQNLRGQRYDIIIPLCDLLTSEFIDLQTALTLYETKPAEGG